MAAIDDDIKKILEDILGKFTSKDYSIAQALIHPGLDSGFLLVEHVYDILNKFGALQRTIDELKPNLDIILPELAGYINQPGNLPPKLATLLKDVVDNLLVRGTGSTPLTGDTVEAFLDRVVDYLSPTMKLLAEKLEIPVSNLPNVDEIVEEASKVDKILRTPSPSRALNLKFERPDDNINISFLGAAAPLIRTGTIPGIEFGFFDIAESGIRSVRLSPLPLPLAPVPVFTMLGFLVYGPIGAAIGATFDGPLFGLQVLYSAFPGYPAFFDVPVEDGVPLTYLPIAGWAQGSHTLPVWPTSGSLPIDLGISYLQISPDVNSLLAEELGGSNPAILPLSLVDWGGTPKITPPTVRAVRPTALAFPERLVNPAPVVIGDPRRFRTFLLYPSRLDEFHGLVGWHAVPLYHSCAGTMLRIVNRQGISKLYEMTAADGDLHCSGRKNGGQQSGGPKNGFDDSFDIDWDQLVNRADCAEELHFDGATGLYNWELFFHLPLQFARQLAANMRFTEANAWLRKVFDPTVSGSKDPARFWRFKALYDEASEGASAPIGEILQDSGVSEAIDIWRSNPSDAHAIARTRRGAYQRATVMQTIDTLVAWGDKLFRENKQESVNEAAMLYLTALGILGERSEEVVPPRPAPRTYNSIRRGGATLNAFGGAMVSIENLISGDGAGASTTGVTSTDAPPPPPSSLGSLSSPSMLYFGIPANEKLRSYWDTIDDRLFKIRHSLDIQGRPRAGVVAAGRLGIEGLQGAKFSNLSCPVPSDSIPNAAPIYRFTFTLQKANEFCAEVKALGGALLSAYEKRDAEALARLRSDHEIRLLEAAEQVRVKQIDEAQTALEAAEYSREGARIRMKYYDELSGEFMNAAEVIKETLSIASSVFQLGSGMAEFAAATIHASPDFAIDIGGDVGFPTATGNAKYSFRYGASHIAAAISAGGRALSVTSSVLGLLSSLAGTQATYQRRMQEWVHQRKLAENDVSLFEKQIESAKIRLQIARMELENHRKQVSNAREVSTFMLEKFTNLELYQWMVEEISRTYMHTYELAYGLAQDALRSYRHEHPDDTVDYLAAPSWDSLRDGLLAGESLQLQLRQLEKKWLEGNVREAEQAKHISLHQHDPGALIRLRQTGICYFNLPERIFDEDHPGQYLRRIKSVSLTIPCVVGPYTGVNCRLTLVNSRIRIKPELVDPSRSGEDQYTDKLMLEGTDDPRFIPGKGRTRSITTSSAQNDSGLFELNLRDERYLPFEGEGAISQWRLELPKETNRFDFSTISDVVLHIKYTARDDSVELRDAASQAAFGHKIGDTMNTSQRWQPQRRVQCFSARAEFSDSWCRFLKGEAGTHSYVLEFDVSLPRFPFTAPGYRIELVSIEAALLGPAKTGEGWTASWSWRESDSNYVVAQNNATFAVAMDDSTPSEARLGGLCSSQLQLSDDWRTDRDPFRRWRFTLQNQPVGVVDVLLLCEYRVVQSAA